MASDKLRRKLRKKLGMSTPQSQPQPAYRPKQQVQANNTVPTKSCCGRGK